MKNLWIALGVIAVIAIAAGGWVVKGLNHAVTMDEDINNSWAQVENQLQRRNDLIPNLVSTVKGYAAHENEVLTKITELRSQWGKANTQAQKMETANEISSVLSRLMMVSERYPDLKANQNFLSLQSQLEGTENRIAVERMRYNDTVKGFNSYRRTVAGGLFTSMRGLTKPREYFEVDAAAKKVPEVKF
ncbi:MAG: LemA family protein [Candidatus Omnitrophica bacterium]|nr:LemA family protein [Candidatus Omnitrophota bacterium]